MHEYYVKNKSKLKKEMNGFLSLVSVELEEDTRIPYSELFEEIWEYYEKNLLERFPYIGGDKASGTRNLTGAYNFIACGEVCKKYGVSLERWGYLTTLCYNRYFDRFPKVAKKLVGKLMKNPRICNSVFKKKAEKNRKIAEQYKGSFETELQTPTKTFYAAYNTNVCPIADFARKYGYMEYMPYICNLDYVMFSQFNTSFYREKTCAAGDGYCDFKFKRDGEIIPFWPCHAANPNDSLK